MTITKNKWVVVEKAGYIGEREVAEFAASRDAWRYIEANYSDDQRDTHGYDRPDNLHIDVRCDWTDEDGDHQQYGLA